MSREQDGLAIRPSDGDFASFLSGYTDAEFKRNMNRLANVWTNARKASVRQKITWTFAQNQPSFGEVYALQRTDERSCANLRPFRPGFCVVAPPQGKAMDLYLTFLLRRTASWLGKLHF
ncbi:hypothetical protein TNCT_132821 [Trichonephila clavata]|uniref:Uncharacterized protein n=1 Tax=Trichonephila clavata TaxID=2740835 RepID=A0A8X6GA13_TRICU|nr:hypothetical protein TNCT_132821 [Trichonephila clavata]